MDAFQQPIFSVSALQHLDKNKGQALILCGRLFPFISELKDISSYDNEHYEVLPYTHRENGDNIFNIPEICKQDLKIESMDDLFEDKSAVVNNDNANNNYVDKTEENVDYDLQKELEAKFDELFGPDDDDCLYRLPCVV